MTKIDNLVCATSYCPIDPPMIIKGKVENGKFISPEISFELTHWFSPVYKLSEKMRKTIYCVKS